MRRFGFFFVPVSVERLSCRRPIHTWYAEGRTISDSISYVSKYRTSVTVRVVFCKGQKIDPIIKKNFGVGYRMFLNILFRNKNRNFYFTRKTLKPSWCLVPNVVFFFLLEWYKRKKSSDVRRTLTIEFSEKEHKYFGCSSTVRCWPHGGSYLVFASLQLK